MFHQDAKFQKSCFISVPCPPPPERGVEVLPVGGVAQLRTLLLQEVNLLPARNVRDENY